jgi:hypothetical protein
MKSPNHFMKVFLIASLTTATLGLVGCLDQSETKPNAPETEVKTNLSEEMSNEIMSLQNLTPEELVVALSRAAYKYKIEKNLPEAALALDQKFQISCLDICTITKHEGK